MSAVRHRNTAPEVSLRRALYALGVRGWRCDYRRVAGRPDIAWPALRVAVFVDGAFWHGHPSRHRPGRSGPYWDEKIANNVARDRRVDGELRAAGWEVLRLWDFEVNKRPRDAASRVDELLRATSTRLPLERRPAWTRDALVPAVTDHARGDASRR